MVGFILLTAVGCLGYAFAVWALISLLHSTACPKGDAWHLVFWHQKPELQTLCQRHVADWMCLPNSGLINEVKVYKQDS